MKMPLNIKLYFKSGRTQLLENVRYTDELREQLNKRIDAGIRISMQCLPYGSPILVTLPDMYRLSRHLGITMNDFFEQYLQVGGASISSWHMFKPYPAHSAPLSVEMDMPCTLLHVNYREDRGNNCSLYESAFTTCKLPPFLFYDPDMLRNDGKGVAVESISEYQCTANRFVSIDDVLKAKAFNDLFHREFDNRRLETLASDNSIVDKLVGFSDEYSQIFKGVIPSHITFNRGSLTF